MPTVFSKPDYTDAEVEKFRKRQLMIYPPAIPFDKPSKRDLTVQEDKDKFKTFEVKLDNNNPDSPTVKYNCLVWEQGSPEDYVKWLMAYTELEEAYPLDTPSKKIDVIRSLLKGEELLAFNTKLDTLTTGARGNRINPTDAHVKQALNDVTLRAFRNDPHAYRRQVTYMRYHLKWTAGNFTTFQYRLKELNNYLKYFPLRANNNTPHSPLSEDVLLEIIENSKPLEYQLALLRNNYDPYDHTLNAYSQYLERLDASYELNKALRSRNKPSSANENATRTNNGRGNNNNNNGNRRGRKRPRSESQPSQRADCPHCGRANPNHAPNECWDKPGNQRPNKRPRNGNKPFTKEQVSFLIKELKGQPEKENQPGSNNSRRKRSREESNLMTQLAANTNRLSLNHSSDDELSNYLCYAISTRPASRIKTTHHSTEVLGEVVNTEGQPQAIRVLLDTGTSSTLILRRYVGRHISTFKTKPVSWSTMGGQFITRRKALVNFKLPEFSNSKEINWVMHVDEVTDPARAQYDMVIGTDLLEALNVDISFARKDITWDEVSIPMKNRGILSDRDVAETLYEVHKEPSLLKMSEDRHNEITKIMYADVDIQAHVQSLKHLTPQEQSELVEVLERHSDMFRGMLGTLNIPPVHFELKPGARPFHAKPFPIPKAYENLTKAECRKFAEEDIWRHTLDSEWAAPSFIVPKKTGDVRVVTDFRELNKWIIRKPYPIPKILDILQKFEKFKYATAIDLRKGYYHIPLDEATQRLCTTVFPWGKYAYKRLPMGIATAPDIFQKAMNDIFGDLDYVIAYLDDVLIISNETDTFADHLSKLDTVFGRLHRVGAKVNLIKTEFFVNEFDYLGYHLSPHGIQPQPKKVEAISRILPPRNKRQLRHFLGMVNYYRDLWPRRSHILAPLSALSSQTAEWNWTEVHQNAFEEAKRMISREALLAYPDFTQPFHIYTDASDTQLGGVIMQNDKPLAFYTRKLNSAQAKYSTGEQELLSIVETLKAFESILMGNRIIVHTDHLNLLYKKLASARLVRWRMLLEEFGPEFKHIEGKKNVVADALSRMDMSPKQYDEENDTHQDRQLSYLTTKDIEEEKFPMSTALIEQLQARDKTLLKKAKSASGYSLKSVEGHELIHYNDRIVVPKPLQQRILSWYHTYMVHPGTTRMLYTIGSVFYWPNLKEQVERTVRTCHKCQLTKKSIKKYGHLPPKKAEVTPWRRVNVDLIGPYTIRTPRKSYTLRCMTMIDPATNWFEIARIDNPTSEECQNVLDSYWLARYPRPREIGYDNGSEFKKYFAELCDNMGLKKKPSLEYNPQSNAIIERVHQVLGDQLRTFELEERDLTPQERTFEPFLTACAYALRSTYHTTLGATPGQLVFGRDMILPVKFKADWALIAQRKQDQINRSNRQENRKRVPHEYREGQKVLLEKPGLLRKLAAPRTGPYEIMRVFKNGTVLLNRGTYTHRVNIRRITPYRENPVN